MNLVILFKFLKVKPIKPANKGIRLEGPVVGIWNRMTVEDLAKAMKKDIGNNISLYVKTI